ncbi:hypothetical protein V2J09_008407 [Rumex salicifolius]
MIEIIMRGNISYLTNWGPLLAAAVRNHVAAIPLTTFIMGRERKMKRKRSDEYSLNPPPAIYSTPAQIESALVIVNKCYEAMELMQKEFSKLSEEAILLGKGPKEIFDIKCRIVFLLEGFFEETSLEGCQNPQTTTYLPASAVMGNLSSYFPTDSHACRVMHEVYKMLCKRELGISAMAISLSKGESVEKQQLKVLRRKSAVVHKLESLFMEIEENTGVEFMDLESSDSEDCDDEDDLSFPAPMKQPGLNMEELRWSSMKETNEKERYLCLSNGYEIWCLDLNRLLSNPHYKLPKVATLSLLGSQLPASVGLFKFGSDVFMIGGQQLPSSINDPSVISDRLQIHGWDNEVSRPHPMSPTACPDLSLSCTEAHLFGPLNKTKFWPLVEKIGGKLHVMDSDPTFLTRPYRDRIFSHEVGGDDGGWREIIPTIQTMDRIVNYVVVGPLMYALTDELEDYTAPLEDVREGCRHLVLDSNTEEWKGCTNYVYAGPSEVRWVRDILTAGIVRCAGEFRHPRVSEQRLYVLVALTMEYNCVVAVAYLVTCTGEVVCYQRLPGLFSEGGPLQPWVMRTGVIFDVEEEEGGAWTMCSVITSELPQLENHGRSSLQYLFINTFRFEVIKSEHVYSAVKRALSASRHEDGGRALEVEFVSFALKNWHVCQTDIEGLSLSLYGDPMYVGWQACFLAPPPP